MLGHKTHGSPGDVVFIHGAGGNGLLWSRTMSFLSGDATAYALDLPGHPAGEITCRTVKDYSESVHGFIAEAGLSRPVVCGHSMGSAVALTLAADHPGDLGALVIVGGGAKLGVDPQILQGLRGEPMKAIEQVITPRSFYSIDHGLGREARAALSVSNLPVFLNDYLACQGFDVRDRLPSLRVAALVVCGDKDQLTPPKWAHYLHENILGSELRMVADAGHMLPLEKPESLASLLSGFLSGLSR